MKKTIIYVGLVLSEVSGIRWGSRKVPSTGKGGLLHPSIAFHPGACSPKTVPAWRHRDPGSLQGTALLWLAQNHPCPRHVWLQVLAEPPASLTVPVFSSITHDTGTPRGNNCRIQMLGH